MIIFGYVSTETKHSGFCVFYDPGSILPGEILFLQFRTISKNSQFCKWKHNQISKTVMLLRTEKISFSKTNSTTFPTQFLECHIGIEFAFYFGSIESFSHGKVLCHTVVNALICDDNAISTRANPIDVSTYKICCFLKSVGIAEIGFLRLVSIQGRKKRRIQSVLSQLKHIQRWASVDKSNLS